MFQAQRRAARYSGDVAWECHESFTTSLESADDPGGAGSCPGAVYVQGVKVARCSTGGRLEALDDDSALRDRCIVGECCDSLGELWQGPVEYRGVPEVAVIALHGPDVSKVVAVDEAEADGLDVTRLRPLQVEAVSKFYTVTGLSRPRERAMIGQGYVPIAQGMASSTADIVSTVRCLCAMHSVPCCELFLENILLGIERSDPVFIDEHCLYLTRCQCAVQRFPERIGFYAIWVEDRGGIKTNSYSSEFLTSYYSKHWNEYLGSRGRIARAFLGHDPVGVALEAEESCRLSLGYLDDNLVRECLGRRAEVGADGVIRAHTGTVVGFLYVTAPRLSVAERARAVLEEFGPCVREGKVGLW